MKNVLVACAALSIAGAAAGSTVRFKFAGTIDEVSGISGPVLLGDPFTIAYNFDSNTPDSEPFPNVGDYMGTIFLVEGFVGAHNVEYSSGDIHILNDGFAGDSYNASVFTAQSSLTINLNDFGFGAFTNDHLPVTLNWTDWDAKRFTIHVDIGPTFWEASGTIEVFSSEIFPDPCYPDCNQDSSLTIADFGCFQAAFVGGLPYADCNQDSSLTIADFGCFQAAFVAGCP